jgi:hypothetical protein
MPSYRLIMRWLLFLLAALALPPLGAQDEQDGPIKMQPELALTIPVVHQGHIVTVKYPILINLATVVKPGMALRVLYIPPVQEDSENLVNAHMGTMAESFSRGSNEGSAPSIPPEIAHELERERRIEWDVPLNFQLALAQMPTDQLHLIYSTSGDNRNLDDERLNFFEGLFLGSPAGGATVLAVEKGSKAEAAGLKAGDQILKVGNYQVPADLAAFPALYVATKQQAKDANATDFTFTVRSRGEQGEHQVKLPMPPSLKSQLMNGF